MTKLNQLVAVEKGVKAQATRELTDAHRVVQQVDRLAGISRTYQPRADDGESLPSESTRVQVSVDEVNRQVVKTLTRLLDVAARKDVANTAAAAAVVVEGETLTVPLPPTFLLFLEKQLIDLRTYVEKLPTLDPAFTWTPDPASGVYRTDPVQTTRTRKVLQNHVLAEATKEHPAQVQAFTVDEVVGDWTTVKFSGAITEERRRELLERVGRLQEAAKFAREEANTQTVTDVSVGEGILGYLFA